MRDDTIGETATSVAPLNQAIDRRGRRRAQGDDRRRDRRGRRCSALLALLLTRTTIGLHMRAAAADFRTARLLGVEADRVIGFAVLLSGVLAAAVAVILTVQFPLVTPEFALRETIIVLVGVVVGGIDRLVDGDARRLRDRVRDGVINGALPTDKTRLPAVGGVRARDPRPAAAARRPLRAGRSRRRRSAYEARADALAPARWSGRCPSSPSAFVATLVSRSTEIYFLNALVSVAIVVAIYVFVGNSGVLSFGQISFVAVGAFAAGVMTIPLESKPGVLPDLFPLLARPHGRQRGLARCSRRAVGGVFAFLVGLPLMRLSGLAAGIATFAVLEITHNVLREWTRIGPGATTLSLVPETTGALQATVGALVVDRGRVRLPAEPARAAAAGDAGGRGRARRASASTSTASGSGRSRSPGRWPASPAACSSTCSARSRPSRSTSS